MASNVRTSLVLLTAGGIMTYSAFKGIGLTDVLSGVSGSNLDPKGGTIANGLSTDVGDIPADASPTGPYGTGTLSDAVANGNTSGLTGLVNFDGKQVSAWIAPILQWARKNGWHGSVTSGYRTDAEQMSAARNYGLEHYGPAGPLGSNHTKINYPGGAVDVTDAAGLNRVLRKWKGTPLKWGALVIGDFVHFSATGH